MTRADLRIASGSLWRGLGCGCLLGAAPLAATGQLHEPEALAAIASLYALLGVTVWSVASLIRRVPVFGPALAALALGVLTFWQLREHGDWLHLATRAGATLGTLTVCCVAAAVALARAPRAAPRPAFGSAALAGLGLCLGASLLDHGSPTLRVHLRDHHRLFASALHRAFDAPVTPLEALFVRAGHTTVAPGPVAAGPIPDPGGRSHVVLIVVDTLRADALGNAGSATPAMPALDRRARDAQVFRDVFANASWTSPSMASLFTGLLPEETGLYELGDRLPGRVTTVAERFRARGYETAGFVTNAAVAAAYGFDQGFDRYREVPDPGAYARADVVRDEVSAWLTDRPDPAAPLFLYVHLMDPHTPYRSGGAPGFPAPEHSRLAYDRELAFLDVQLDALLDDVAGALPGPRRVVLTADHGEEFGERGGYGHGHSLQPELLHVPLLVFGSGATGSLDARLELRDVRDLLLALGSHRELDVAGWAEAHARDLRTASSYATPGSWRKLRALRPYAARRLRAVERPGAMLVWSGFGDTRSLYDPSAAPGQRRNVIGSRSELAQRLSKRLDASSVNASRRDAVRDAELEDRLAALGYAR